MRLANHPLQPMRVTAKSGGWFVTDDRDVLDLSGGPLVQSLASFPDLAGAAMAAVTPSSGFDSPAKEEIEGLVLTETFPDGGALWANSGSDGMEVALWACDVYRRQLGFSNRPTYWVRRAGYHGNTFLTRALSTRGGVSDDVGIDVRVIDEHDPERPYEPDWGVDEPTAGLRDTQLFRSLDQALRDGELRAGAVLVLESLPTTGRMFRYAPQTLAELFAWCRQNSVFTIVDEVAAGAFRHGWFSIVGAIRALPPGAPGQASLPDVTVLSKGLASGAYPLACAVSSRAVARAVLARPHKALSFTHSLTDAGARVALYSVDRQRRFASDGLATRDQLVADSCARLARLLGNDRARFGLSRTPTTIRIDIPKQFASSLRSALDRHRLWCYIGTGVFPTHGAEPEARCFVHVCPPFDLANDDQRAAFNAFIDCMTRTLSEWSGH